MTWYGVELHTEAFVLFALIVGLTIAAVNFLLPSFFSFKSRAVLRLFRQKDSLVKAAVIATILLMVMVVFAYGFDDCSGSGVCENKFRKLLKSSPNEFGDALAGISATLAFLWIIVTVIMQSKELRAQREELSLARTEFNRMAKAQEEQVELIVAQTEMLQDAQKHRDEVREREKLDGILWRYVRVVEFVQPALYWELKKRVASGYSTYSHPNTSDEIDRLYLFSEDRSGILDERVYSLTKSIGYFSISLNQVRKDAIIWHRPSKSYAEEILEALKLILDFSEKSSDATKLRIHALFLSAMYEELRKLLDQNIWQREERDPQ